LRARRFEQAPGICEQRIREQQIGIVEEMHELRVEACARFRALEPFLRKRKRRVRLERRAVLCDRPIPDLACLERERARLGKLDLVHALALLGLQQAVAGSFRAGAQRERRREVLGRVAVVFLGQRRGAARHRTIEIARHDRRAQRTQRRLRCRPLRQ
jgi:hypothetical protein